MRGSNLAGCRMQPRASSNGNLHQNLDENFFFFFHKKSDYLQALGKRMKKYIQILPMLLFSPIGWQILARQKLSRTAGISKYTNFWWDIKQEGSCMELCCPIFSDDIKSMPRWSTGCNPSTRFKARDDIARNTVNGGGVPALNTPCELGDVEASKTWATEELYSRNRQMISNDFNLRNKNIVVLLPRQIDIQDSFLYPQKI